VTHSGGRAAGVDVAPREGGRRPAFADWAFADWAFDDWARALTGADFARGGFGGAFDRDAVTV